MSDAALPNPIPPLDASPEITAMVELERLAKAATPGPWHVDKYNAYIWGPQGEMVADSGGAGLPDDAVIRARGTGGKLPIPENMAYVAAANPETILKLLALLRRLGEREARMREAEQAMRRAQVMGPNTVSVDGEDGPFDSNAARLKIWFRSWDDALAVAALAAGKEGE